MSNLVLIRLLNLVFAFWSFVILTIIRYSSNNDDRYKNSTRLQKEHSILETTSYTFVLFGMVESMPLVYSLSIYVQGKTPLSNDVLTIYVDIEKVFQKYQTVIIYRHPPRPYSRTLNQFFLQFTQFMMLLTLCTLVAIVLVVSGVSCYSFEPIDVTWILWFIKVALNYIVYLELKETTKFTGYRSATIVYKEPPKPNTQPNTIVAAFENHYEIKWRYI